MQTHIIGVRKPVSLGFSAPASKTAKPAVTQHALQGTCFAVVSNALAARMQGYTANKSKTGNGTMYACYGTYAQAYAHIKARKMQLYASIVSW